MIRPTPRAVLRWRGSAATTGIPSTPSHVARGLTPDDACDLVQGLLADLIERGDLAAADRDRGRFRAFLRAACVHYLAHRREHDGALKRGGGRRRVSDRPARSPRARTAASPPTNDGRAAVRASLGSDVA